MLKAITDDGVKVKDYMASTLMDNFEWGSAFSTPYVIHFVNFENKPNLTRIPKKSAKFFKQLKSRSLKMLTNDALLFTFAVALIYS